MPAAAQEAGIKPPAVLVVGGVVELAKSLTWWENRPLWGKTVLVTRSRDQASRLVELLNAAGARCLEVPTIEIAPPADFAPLDAALQHLGRYEWVIFTSANGVRAFMDRLFHMGLDVRALGRARLAVIGPATAQALREFSLVAEVVPDTFQAEGLLEVLEPKLLGGTRVLIARAEQARDVLPEGLVELGVKARRGAGVSRPAADVGAAGGCRGAGVGASGHPHLHQFEHGPQLRRSNRQRTFSGISRPGHRGLHRPHHHRHFAGIRPHAPDRAGRVHHPGPGRGDCGIF